MSQSENHNIPDFLLKSLSEDKPLSSKGMEQVGGIWHASSGFQYPEVDLDSKWSHFKSSIGADMQVTHRGPRYAMFRWVAAAVVLLVFGFAISQYYFTDPGFTAIYKTSTEKQQVKLPDGTELLLNSNTELLVNTINDERREIMLKSGQAYFSVKHNDLPFVVITPKGNISVLGTEFDVKAYKGQQFSVYLRKGKIQFNRSTGTLSIKPGQMLSEGVDGKMTLTTVSERLALAWKDGQLIFENTSLSEIIQALESKFGVKFIYDEKFKDEKYNVNAEDLTASQVAELLSKLTNSTVSVQ